MLGDFEQAGPALERLVRAGPVPVRFAPAGPSVGDSARAGSLPAHLVRTVQARLVPVRLAWPPKLGIASTGFQMDPLQSAARPER